MKNSHQKAKNSQKNQISKIVMSDRSTMGKIVPIVLVLCGMGHLAVTSLSGSTGNTTFSRNKGGAYARRRVVPINPQTAYQTAVRNKFGAFSSTWKTLTAAQRTAWNACTSQFTRKNRLANIITLSGINVYKELNQNLYNAGVAAISVPPVPVAPLNVSSLSVAVSATASTMVSTFAVSPTPALTYTLVYATAGMSPGISNFKNKLRLIGVLAPATATGATLQALYVAKFGATVIGEKYGFAFVAVHGTSGQKSPAVTASAIAV